MEFWEINKYKYNSVNLTHTALDRCRIIKYSGLPDDTNTTNNYSNQKFHIT